MNSTTSRILSTVLATGVFSLATALPASAIPDPGHPVNPAGAGVGTFSDTGSQTTIREVFVDDGAIEYVQVGLGALAGLTLAGAAAVAVRRVGHPGLHPA